MTTGLQDINGQQSTDSKTKGSTVTPITTQGPTMISPSPPSAVKNPDGSTSITTNGVTVTKDTTGTVIPNPTSNPVTQPTTNPDGTPRVIPNQPKPGDSTSIGVVDLAGQLVNDPTAIFNDDMLLSQNLPNISDADLKAGLIDPNSAVYKKLKDLGIDPATVSNLAKATTTNATAGQATSTNATAGQATATTAQASLVQAVQAKLAATPVTDPTYAKISALANQLQAAQGTVSQNSLVDAEGNLIDTEATGKGLNETGKALNDYAKQSISSVIDTSTPQGKLLAQQLGEGNYVDSKATMKGQLEILQSEFFDSTTGEAKIPAWAAGTARNVGRIAAFTGMTGSAATAAMAQALMEASLPIAQADSAFFQTVTLKNLDNKQQSIINKAQTLAKFDLANMDARMQAAVVNSQAFLAMDMKNLDNTQQAAVINNQNRIQSILEDSKAENANRLFIAQSQNDMNKFYDSLNASIAQYNATSLSTMSQFNASEKNDVSQSNAALTTQTNIANAAEKNDIAQSNAALKTQVSLANSAEKNDASQFNANQTNQAKEFNASQINDIAKFNVDIENNREQFYKEQQFAIDTANAKWRQTVTLTENAQQFEANATDVKNAVGVSTEELNRLWDRADSILDYVWKSAENEADRKATLAGIKLQGSLDAKEADSAGWGNLLGTVAGAAASSFFGWLF